MFLAYLNVLAYLYVLAYLNVLVYLYVLAYLNVFSIYLLLKAAMRRHQAIRDAGSKYAVARLCTPDH